MCDVLIVVEARAKSGTLITVDCAIEQGRTVMIVPGRLTDSLSAGCLGLLSQGALPATGIDSVMEQLAVKKPLGNTVQIRPEAGRRKKVSRIVIEDREISEELKAIADVLTIEPRSIEAIAQAAKTSPESAMIILTKLEIEGIARETWPGYFVKTPELA